MATLLAAPSVHSVTLSSVGNRPLPYPLEEFNVVLRPLHYLRLVSFTPTGRMEWESALPTFTNFDTLAVSHGHISLLPFLPSNLRRLVIYFSRIYFSESLLGPTLARIIADRACRTRTTTLVLARRRPTFPNLERLHLADDEGGNVVKSGNAIAAYEVVRSACEGRGTAFTVGSGLLGDLV